MDIIEKFAELGVDNAPGQESRQRSAALDARGSFHGPYVDFSHGDVNAFPPTPGSFTAFSDGVTEGAAQAYTPYRGRASVLVDVAEKLSRFTGARIDPDRNLLLAPGTQGALFLAMGACIMRGDKVAFVEPDYFANRKMAAFFDAQPIPVPMRYREAKSGAGLDLEALERAFSDGARLFLFSSPNNPTGAVYSEAEVRAIATLAKRYDATLIVDELYARQVFDGRQYPHTCALPEAPENIITIIGPSKTESLSGYRLGVAFGTEAIIDRMEKLLAIMALRCPGYNQAVFSTWFNEPAGWMEARVAAHQRIRDDILSALSGVEGVSARPTEGGSYLFVDIPELDVSLHDFIRILRTHADVAITPGTEFGPQFLHSFRINFSQDHDNAVAAMKRTMQMLELYRK